MREKSVKILFSVGPLYRYATDECISMIEKVSPDLKITNVTDLVMAELAGDADASRELDKHLADAEILFGRQYLKNLPLRAPKLKWVQHPMAGVEDFLVKEFIDSPVILTNACGNHSQVAELVMSYILMFSKHIPEVFRNQQTGGWIKPKRMCDVLEGKTVGILGLGHIGTEVARFSKAFRMRVIGVRSKKKNTRYADEVYPPEQLKTVLSQSDFVVVALALTPDTNQLIGKDCFLAMKPTAFIINIARGNIIDEPALIQALKDNTIAGAGLDAHSLEPLPSDNELWKLSNVIITPHIGGATVDYMQNSTLIFNANLKRYLKGQKLRNVVDKQRGH